MICSFQYLVWNLKLSFYLTAFLPFVVWLEVGILWHRIAPPDLPSVLRLGICGHLRNGIFPLNQLIGEKKQSSFPAQAYLRFQILRSIGILLASKVAPCLSQQCVISCPFKSSRATGITKPFKLAGLLWSATKISQASAYHNPGQTYQNIQKQMAPMLLVTSTGAIHIEPIQALYLTFHTYFDGRN